ncbi:hypothetical protein ACWCQM_11800 [Streptomyces sp. NPDC002125]
MTLPQAALHAALCASLGAAAALLLHHGHRRRHGPGDGNTGRHTTEGEPT